MRFWGLYGALKLSNLRRGGSSIANEFYYQEIKQLKNLVHKGLRNG